MWYYRTKLLDRKKAMADGSRQFRCRAECNGDVMAFWEWVGKARKPVRDMQVGPTSLPCVPDVICTFFSTAKTRDLRRWMRTAAPDLHVMMDTLRLANRYIGERNFRSDYDDVDTDDEDLA